jgi:Domain of unknown function (DUF4232)
MRRTAAAAGAAALAIAAAGCGGTRSVTVTTTRVVTTTRTVTQTTPSAAGACAASALGGAFKGVPGSAGAGQISYALTLSNASSSACFATGLPVVQLLDARGNPLPTHVSPAHPGQQAAVKVTLVPGASAKAEARFSPDVPGPGEQHPGRCEPIAVQLRVTATGGGTLDVPVTPPTSVCEHGSLRFDVLTSAG